MYKNEASKQAFFQDILEIYKSDYAGAADPLFDKTLSDSLKKSKGLRKGEADEILEDMLKGVYYSGEFSGRLVPSRDREKNRSRNLEFKPNHRQKLLKIMETNFDVVFANPECDYSHKDDSVTEYPFLGMCSAAVVKKSSCEVVEEFKERIVYVPTKDGRGEIISFYFAVVAEYDRENNGEIFRREFYNLNQDTFELIQIPMPKEITYCDLEFSQIAFMHPFKHADKGTKQVPAFNDVKLMSTVFDFYNSGIPIETTVLLKFHALKDNINGINVEGVVPSYWRITPQDLETLGLSKALHNLDLDVELFSDVDIELLKSIEGKSETIKASHAVDASCVYVYPKGDTKHDDLESWITWLRLYNSGLEVDRKIFKDFDDRSDDDLRLIRDDIVRRFFTSNLRILNDFEYQMISKYAK